VPSPDQVFGTALEQVHHAAAQRRGTDEYYRHVLAKAREAGHTFEEIAEAAGVTRSAVFQILNPKERTK
jgi:predicted DNA-binding protein YlxM (UPF0122 family)